MSIRRLLLLTAATVLASLAAGCAVDAAPPVLVTSEPPASELGAPEPASGTPTASNPAVQELARRVLSEALGIPMEEIQVLRAEFVDWPDASLGCPQPGMTYAQVVTPGMRITLEAGGQAYSVHTDLGDAAVVCIDGAVLQGPLLAVTPGAIDDAGPWMPVD